MSPAAALRRALGPVFVAAGVLHFTHTSAFAAIVPDALPAHRELVWASGVAEIVGGLAVMHPRTRPLGGLWLVAVLLAVFPANVHMAVHAERYPALPEALLWLRLPLQGALIWWAWNATQDRRRRGTTRV
ncbi:MAG: hypothetical protein M3P39_08000 [Actinomycetota bacterium]|nr:hypothetical protein [Actinomycetota bacterium]